MMICLRPRIVPARRLRALLVLALLWTVGRGDAGEIPRATFSRDGVPLKVMRSEAKRDSFLHYYTDLIRCYETAEVPAADYAVLDALVEDAHRLVPAPPATAEARKIAIQRIRNLVENNYRERIKALAFTKVILPEQYTNDCVHRSLIYHALGCEVGLPVYLVALPKCKTAETYHVALRIDPDGRHRLDPADHPDNAGDFYWEATAGKEEERKYYLDHFSFTPDLLKREVYLADLDCAEGFAYFGSALLMSAKDQRKVTAATAREFIELARAMAAVSRVPSNLRNAASGIFISANAIVEKRDAKNDGWEAVRVKNDNLHYYREALGMMDRALALDGTDWMWQQDRSNWNQYIKSVERSVDQAQKANKL